MKKNPVYANAMLQAKEKVILRWATGLGCQSEAAAYPTKMDGKSQWQCRAHTGEDHLETKMKRRRKNEKKKNGRQD